MTSANEVILSTVGEALEFLESFAGADAKEVPENISIKGDLSKLSIYVNGEDYHKSFPGEFARGLWEFQEAIYNAVAFSIYGVEDLRKLTAEQYEAFKIVFEVEEGSLDIQALLEEFLKSLAAGIASMDSKHKVIAVVAVAAILVSGWGAVHIMESNVEAKKAQVTAEVDAKKSVVDAEAKVKLEQERTKQFEILANVAKSNGIASQFAKATEDGTRAVMKRARGATEVRVGGAKFDKDDIEELNSRAAREKATADIITDDFLVVRVETRDSSSTKLVLSSKQTGEFQALLQDEDFDADELNQLWNAIKNRNRLKLEVNATKMRGVIKSAQVVKIVHTGAKAAPPVIAAQQ